jgi:hypothetical protein
MKRLMLFVSLSMLFLISYSSGNNYLRKSATSEDSIKMIEKVYLHLDRYSYYPGDDIWFKAYLIDASDRLLTDHSNNLHVELISTGLKLIDSRIVRLYSGLGKGDFHIPSTLKSGRYLIRAYTNYMRNFGEDLFYYKEIMIINSSAITKSSPDSISDSENKLDIAFFPESGSMVDNTASIIAFKSTNSAGKSSNVSGRIYSSTGEMITTFSSTHKGMGVFTLTPVPGLRYYAITQELRGGLLRFELPQSLPEGIIMNVSKNNSEGLSLVFRTNSETLPLFLDHELNLAVSQHGTVLNSYSFRISSMNSFFNLPSNNLPEGMLMLTLSSPENIPLCERLVFIKGKEEVYLKVKTNKSVYDKRDSVSVRISLKADSSDNSRDAFLSLSSTEELLSENLQESGSTISSWFLLESEIRGPVEDPLYYFDPSNPGRLKDMDLLLLTQGWRDFKWRHQKTEYLPENGFVISGRVRKKFADVPVENSTVSIGIFGTGKPILGLFPVDSSGTFSIKGLDIAGRRRLIASVTDNKDNLKGMLILDSIKYSPADMNSLKTKSGNSKDRGNFFLNNDLTRVNTSNKNNLQKYVQYVEYKQSIQKKYKLSDTIQLGEIKVTARKVEIQESARSQSIRYLSAIPDKELVITPEMNRYNDVYQLVSMKFINPVKVDRLISHRMQNPIFLIDGMRVSMDELKALPVNMIERIDVLDNPASYAAFGTMINLMDMTTTVRFTTTTSSTGKTVPIAVVSKSDNKADGVVSIILKRDFDNSRQLFHSANISFSGFDEPRIFYSPKHHTTLEKDYKPDLRNTLYWEPDIEMENNKDYFVNYYNTDNSSTVKIKVEGITSSGIPVTASTEYVIK